MNTRPATFRSVGKRHAGQDYDPAAVRLDAVPDAVEIRLQLRGQLNQLQAAVKSGSSHDKMAMLSQYITTQTSEMLAVRQRLSRVQTIDHSLERRSRIIIPAAFHSVKVNASTRLLQNKPREPYVSSSVFSIFATRVLVFPEHGPASDQRQVIGIKKLWMLIDSLVTQRIDKTFPLCLLHSELH